MCVDVAHLVFVTFCDADYEVVDNRLDSAEGSDIFAVAVVNFNVDGFFRGEREGNGQVRKVLYKFPCDVKRYVSVPVRQRDRRR